MSDVSPFCRAHRYAALLAVALGPSCASSPAHEISDCLPGPPVPAEWSRVALPEFGISVAVPRSYTLTRIPALLARGRAVGAFDIERVGTAAHDSSPPWACSPQSSPACASPSVRCVIERDGRRLYVEIATLGPKDPAGYNHNWLENPAPEFRPHVVQAVWQVGPDRWRVVSGHSRDPAAQDELRTIIGSLQFDAP